MVYNFEKIFEGSVRPRFAWIESSSLLRYNPSKPRTILLFVDFFPLLRGMIYQVFQ